MNKKLIYGASLFSLFLFFSSCDIIEVVEDPETGELSFALGWFGEDQVSTVPTTTNLGFDEGNLPSSVDLTSYFPPTGDQGQYGTCVAWAIAYNLRTALNAQSNNLSSSALAQSGNQFSPKDLFTAIPDSYKGSGCGGTNFSYALDVAQERGIASMQTVPYQSLGSCSQSSLNSSWTAEASQNKIKYWRKLDPTVSSIKQNLANNIPVVFGARLADNFMTWNSSSVLTSSTSYFNVGQHAYHAMIIAGYDDNKGPGGAFKVLNSWGNNWGDSGDIWVDYSYFINEFCSTSNGDKPLFIAAEDEGHVTPPEDNNIQGSGVDLAPWVFEDHSNFPSTGEITERIITFNLYNIGDQTAYASDDWSFYYIYFNAYNADDYGVIFYDDFNTSVAPGTFECLTNYNCVFNYDIGAGENMVSTVFAQDQISRTYYMPNITGDYYLVMIADLGDVYAETDELNNLFYTTDDPLYFENGYNGRSPEGFRFKNKESLALQGSHFNTVVNSNFKNAYTSEEIKAFFKKEISSGRIFDKVHKVEGTGQATYN